MNSGIQFINISTYPNNEDLFLWINPTKNKTNFMLDILAVKAFNITKDVFYQIERNQIKISFILLNNLLIIACAELEIQFQMLEAIIEEIYNQFTEFYGGIYENYSSLVPDTFNGFSELIVEIIANINNKVKFVLTFCKACDSNIKVCVKNSLIKNSKDFPVSLVYIHNAHGLLIYLDKNFKVRAAEIVNISG